MVDHAQRKVSLLENDCREHISSEQKVFEARLEQVTQERDRLKKELADTERAQAQAELEADERHHNAQQQATAKYAKLHRRLEAFRGSAGEQAEAQVAAFRQQHKALRAFTVSKLREGMSALEYVRSMMLKECEKLQLEVRPRIGLLGFPSREHQCLATPTSRESSPALGLAFVLLPDARACRGFCPCLSSWCALSSEVNTLHISEKTIKVRLQELVAAIRAEVREFHRISTPD